MKSGFGRKLLLIALFSVVWALPASAIPELQLYIEGSTYDQNTQTWVTNSSNFKLWVLGDVSKFGSILDVRLAAAYLTGEVGTITITPTMTGVLPDPSTPGFPVQDLSLGADGTRPVKSDGTLLPPHGIYGPGTSFKQYSLGNMTLTDSPIGDFSFGYPGTFPDAGQINAYNVSITGYSMVHFDAFNHVESKTKSLFAPFSHDALGTPSVPEPASLLLLGIGISGTAAMKLRRRRKS
jgi:PEP-CTERM motif-containing protein